MAHYCGIDFGTSNSVVTVLEDELRDDAADRGGRLRAERILATHGVRAGGDDFDGAIMWNRLVGQFGYGTHYESFGRMLPVPVHIFHIISRWDLGYFIFRAIEAAKIDLSSGERSSIDYEHGKLRIHEAITREEFESHIADHVARIRAAVDETLALAGNPAVNAAFLTGGSSRVPAVRSVLADVVGEDRIIDDVDRFQSVSLGLALAARDRGLNATATEE